MRALRLCSEQVETEAISDFELRISNLREPWFKSETRNPKFEISQSLVVGYRSALGACFGPGKVLQQSDDGRMVQGPPTFDPKGREEFLDDGGSRQGNL